MVQLRPCHFLAALSKGVSFKVNYSGVLAGSPGSQMAEKTSHLPHSRGTKASSVLLINWIASYASPSKRMGNRRSLVYVTPAGVFYCWSGIRLNGVSTVGFDLIQSTTCAAVANQTSGFVFM